MLHIQLSMKLQTLKNNKEKLSYLYRTQELLRLEHNEKGKDFRDGKITKKVFRDYQSKDFEPRLEKVLSKRNKILEEEGVVKTEIDIDGKETRTEKQKVFDEIKVSGKKETKFDKDINLEEI